MIKTDEDGRVSAASFTFHCGEGEREVAPPEGFELASARQWRLEAGRLVHSPLPDAPDADSEGDDGALEERLSALSEGLSRLETKLEGLRSGLAAFRDALSDTPLELPSLRDLFSEYPTRMEGGEG